jgi:hypothetical protein
MEDSFKEYFLSNGLTDIYTPRDTGDLPDNSVIIQYTVDSVTDDHMAKISNTGTGENEHDRFTGTLSIDICTDRTIQTKIDGYRDMHAFRKSLIRKLMTYGAINGKFDGITPLDLPYYNLYKITFASDTGDNRDETLDGAILQYQILFMILPEAWKS